MVVLGRLLYALTLCALAVAGSGQRVSVSIDLGWRFFYGNPQNVCNTPFHQNYTVRVVVLLLILSQVVQLMKTSPCGFQLKFTSSWKCDSDSDERPLSKAKHWQVPVITIRITNATTHLHSGGSPIQVVRHGVRVACHGCHAITVIAQ